jgi:hypothetical protein
MAQLNMWAGYQRFTLKMVTTWTSETLLSYHITVLRRNSENHDLNFHGSGILDYVNQF